MHIIFSIHIFKRCFNVSIKFTLHVNIPQTVYSFRPKVYNLWTDNTMTKAINAVENDGFSVQCAAVEYNVPQSTLGDGISGRTLPGV